MADNHWYPFYVGDYDRKTAHLSMLEHGAYRLLIDHYYATRMPLPNDPVKLYRICRARSPSERKAVLSVVAEFFVEDGTLMRHEKCDSEIDKQLKYKESQSAKAKLRHSPGNAAAYARTRVPQPQLQPKKEKKELPPTPSKVSLDQLSVDHIAEWLSKKRAVGKYLLHDEHHILEQFKNYCKSKGKKYADYIAGYQNAFEWERLQPKSGIAMQPIGKSRWTSAAEQIIAEDRAEAARLRGE